MVTEAVTNNKFRVKKKQGQEAEGEEKAIILSPVLYANCYFSYLCLYILSAQKKVLFKQKTFCYEDISYKTGCFFLSLYIYIRILLK